MDESKQVCIYGLVDPRDGMIHYVGRTRAALRSRLSGHRADIALCWDGKARGAGQDKIAWLTDLQRAGLSPTIKILEEVNSDGAVDAEKRWVQALFKAGVPLTNQQWRPKSCVDDPSWLRGYAAALVEMQRLCGHPSAVRTTIETSGIALEKFKRAGVEDIDLRELAKCCGEPLRERKRRARAFPSEKDRAVERPPLRRLVTV